jgi:C1A family cysteine protease
MRRSICLVLVVCALAHTVQSVVDSGDAQRQFSAFVNRFGKKYEVPEIFVRFNVFKHNLEQMDEHNRGNHSWTMAVNEFSDLTSDEFYAALIRPWSEDERPQGPVANVLESVPTDTFDWRKQGAVTSIKNQGSCGSCWTFSGAGTMESLLFINTKALVDLSEQQLLDCAGPYGNHGCNGGMPWSTFDYARDRGICLLSEYSYIGRQGQCKQCKPRMRTNGYFQLSGEGQFPSVIKQNPISLGLDVTNWQHYSGGVFNGPCGAQPQHAVIGIGWQDSAWIIKNSWGTSWGEGGYIRLAANKNLCNVGKWATSPRFGSGDE